MLVGHQPRGATSTGLRNWVVKLEVFAISGALIGVGGLLYAFVNGTPPPPISFGIIYSVIFIAIPIAAGMRDLSSIWLVAAAFTCIPIALEPLEISPNLLSGAILLSALIMGQNRGRISGWLRRIGEMLRGGSTKPAPSVELVGTAATGTAVGVPRREMAALAPSPAQPRGELDGHGIVVDFGGVRAVDGVHIHIDAGDRLGIVGANGAGKTTLLNALSGFVPFQGTVTLGGEDITHWPPFARARRGIRRTFQLPRLVDLLTIEQNVLCGHGDDAERRERVGWLLERFGLTTSRGLPVAALPFGVRRQVECIRALSRAPQILLLDEPASGLEDDEAERLADILLELQSREGWALMVIEHSLEFITRVARCLMVMEDGRLLTTGPLGEVMQQPEVRRVYLGEMVTA